MIKEQIIIGIMLLIAAPAISQIDLQRNGGKDSIAPFEEILTLPPAYQPFLQPLSNLDDKRSKGQIPDTFTGNPASEIDLQIQKLREEKRQVQITNYLIIVLLLLALTAGSFFFVRNRMKRKLAESELRNQKLLSEKIRHELAAKHQDLTNLALEIARKNELFIKTNETLREIELQQLPAEHQAKIRKLIQHNVNQLRIDEDLKELLLNIEQVNTDFFGKLKEMAPDLTPSEKQLCALLRLNLSTKDIASIRNISPKSVEMARYRLRKKLPIDTGDDIYGFIQRI